MGDVPLGDLLLPPTKRSAKRAHLDRVVGVGHVGREALHSLQRE